MGKRRGAKLKEQECGRAMGAETGFHCFGAVATGLDQRHPASEGHACGGPKGWMEFGRHKASTTTTAGASLAVSYLMSNRPSRPFVPDHSLGRAPASPLSCCFTCQGRRRTERTETQRRSSALESINKQWRRPRHSCSLFRPCRRARVDGKSSMMTRGVGTHEMTSCQHGGRRRDHWGIRMLAKHCHQNKTISCSDGGRSGLVEVARHRTRGMYRQIHGSLAVPHFHVDGWCGVVWLCRES
ncbi:hypothetical protein QBC32DRAFT_349027 [Pseudoneurospora amorphoporcata]|uniref:Uncharacterized protein n=1 Tax=Pseudoneurospora amorphoporcata TaxID=241081 RepID=A0AAN6NSM4_9PEZI|nr:hypothetical protein QBC32DRAFT_349027 [Pseudoneurospora amorphoporcata]